MTDTLSYWHFLAATRSTTTTLIVAMCRSSAGMMRLLMRMLEVVGATPLIALIALVPSIATRLAMSTLIAPIRRAVSKRIAMAISTML